MRRPVLQRIFLLFTQRDVIHKAGHDDVVFDIDPFKTPASWHEDTETSG